jgi:hypothetical protein
MIAEHITRRPMVARNWRAVLGVMAVLGLLMLPGIALPDGCDDCDDVEGPFSSVLVTAGCASPVGICTHGLLTGDLEATYDFTMLTLVPDPIDPTAEVYTGRSVITTKGGSQLFTNDTGVIHPGSVPAPFVTTANIVSGTGKFQNVCGGKIVASGKLNFATGQAVGTYTGEICQ